MSYKKYFKTWFLARAFFPVNIWWIWSENIFIAELSDLTSRNLMLDFRVEWLLPQPLNVVLPFFNRKLR